MTLVCPSGQNPLQVYLSATLYLPAFYGLIELPYFLNSPGVQVMTVPTREGIRVGDFSIFFVWQGITFLSRPAGIALEACKF
jgi:hypothetical protein